MAAGLYDLVKEYATATPERKAKIQAERAQRFPKVEGWPQYPEMIWCEVAQNVWRWDLLTVGATYMDNDGNVVGDHHG